MRLWSEEFRTKTVVQIMTMPVSTANLVWGKFLASWIFSGLALLLTFPFWITVNLLGDPDNGWGWLADQGDDILQTDWVTDCITYLKSAGKYYR